MDFLKKLITKFWEDNKEKIFEALKAAARYSVFFLMSWLVSYLGELPSSQTTIIGLSLLTFADKWLHENWKENKREGIRGITPF